MLASKSVKLAWIFLVLIVVDCSQRTGSQVSDTREPTARKAGLIEEFYETYGKPELDSNDERRFVTVEHEFYHTTLDCELRIPVLVVHILEKKKMTDEPTERPRGFDPDPNVRNKKCISDTDDYKNSGFDRGHLAPAADFAGYGEEALQQSFFTSNIAPQIGDGFNSGIWSQFEGQVRDLARTRKQLVILTGTISNGDRKFFSGTDASVASVAKTENSVRGMKPVTGIGKDDVRIPDYYYKIVFDPHAERGQSTVWAFLMENMDHRTDTKATVARKQVPVDRIEELSGYDFFSKLPKPDQERMESTKQRLWPKR